MANIFDIAKVAYNAQRKYCISVGITSEPEWKDLGDVRTSSICNGVRTIVENPELSDEQLHENWMLNRYHEGWKYGEAKDEEKKEHPMLVPYNDLPETEKRKKTIFRDVVEKLKNEKVIDTTGEFLTGKK
jgi:hypothetical protein